VIYLDSSALLKLLFQEQESDALELWLGLHRDVPKVSSELAKVEVLRACRRLSRRSLPTAELLLSQIDLIPLAGPVVDQASHIEGKALRSLDALHLASALTLGADLSFFLAYDQRLTAAAQDAGLPAVRPEP
jgi:predicted nucleic acid-binding protein